MPLCVTLLFGLLLITRPGWAQNPAPALAPARTPAPVDSTRLNQSAADSIPPAEGNERVNGAIRVGSSTLTPDDSGAVATDTAVVTPKQEAQIRRIIPRRATYRSLMLPGLGQAYNRQYYKIPFIYAGFGVMGYLLVHYRGLAKEAENGYRLLLYGQPVSDAHYVTNVAPGIVPSELAQPVLIPAQSEKVSQVIINDRVVYTTTGAKFYYDTFRRYRDINTILIIALWGLNAVEANVAAHLKTFDLSDDISMRIHPDVLPMPGFGLVPGIRVTWTFR